MYCHRNKTKECQSSILNIIRKHQLDLELTPIFCMKLCFLCPGQYTLDLNRSLIVASTEEELLRKLEASIHSQDFIN
jgi:hypothetical protein